MHLMGVVHRHDDEHEPALDKVHESRSARVIHEIQSRTLLSTQHFTCSYARLHSWPG